jgi:hypothetical protein
VVSEDGDEEIDEQVCDDNIDQFVFRDRPISGNEIFNDEMAERLAIFANFMHDDIAELFAPRVSTMIEARKNNVGNI